MPQGRRNRNGIPPVNPNPRPPNEPRGQSNATRSPMDRLSKALGRYTQNANTPPIPGAAPQTPLSASGVSGGLASGTSALGMSSFSPTQGQPDPRTPDYWRNVNNLLFNTQSTIGQLNLQGSRDTTDYGKALGDLQTSRGREQRGLGEEAMRSGLANSGWLARNEAEQSHDYLRNYEDLQTGYTRSQQDRSTATSQAIQDYIAGEGEQAGTALSDYYATQQDQAQQGNPLLRPRDVRQITRAIRGGNQGGNNRGGNNRRGRRGR